MNLGEDDLTILTDQIGDKVAPNVTILRGNNGEFKLAGKRAGVAGRIRKRDYETSIQSDYRFS